MGLGLDHGVPIYKYIILKLNKIFFASFFFLNFTIQKICRVALAQLISDEELRAGERIWP